MLCVEQGSGEMGWGNLTDAGGGDPVVPEESIGQAVLRALVQRAWRL